MKQKLKRIAALLLAAVLLTGFLPVQTYAADTWSNWSTTYPSGKSQIESKTEYRYADKQTTTSTSSSLSGWSRVGSYNSYGTWGNWSAWTTGSLASSDTVDVQTSTLYRYYCFKCPTCGGREPYQGKSDCGRYSLTASNWEQRWSPIAYNNSKFKSYSYTTGKFYTESLGDGLRWNFSAGNRYHTAVGTKDSDSDATVIANGYRYRTRSKSVVYTYEKWGSWSAWSTTSVTSSSTRKVETRTLYRYKIVQNTDVKTGTCGKNLKWSYDKNTKTLTISGKGAMYSYQNKATPWENLTIKKVVIKKGVTSVGACAFEGNYDVTSVSLPNTLTSIGTYGFSCCSKMTKITLPKSLKSFGAAAFSGTPVTAFKLEKGSKYFSTSSGVLFDKKKTKLIAYPGGKKDKSYSIPSGVKTICAKAFEGSELYCSSLYVTKLTIPKSVTTIQNMAFYESGIQKYYFKGKAPKLGKYVFYGEGCDSTIYYPSKYKSDWKKTIASLKKENPDGEDFFSLDYKTWKG